MLILQRLPERHDQSTIIVLPAHRVGERKIQFDNLLQGNSPAGRVMFRDHQALPAVGIRHDHHLIDREFGLDWKIIRYEDDHVEKKPRDHKSNGQEEGRSLLAGGRFGQRHCVQGTRSMAHEQDTVSVIDPCQHPSTQVLVC